MDRLRKLWYGLCVEGGEGDAFAGLPDGYDDVVSWMEAEKISGLKLRSVSQPVDEGKLTLPV